ncbi:MAG: hypothetical protein ACLFR1_13460 [Spirochaetia bacterium]
MIQEIKILAGLKARHIYHDKRKSALLTETEEKEYVLTDVMQFHFLELEKMNFDDKPDFTTRLEK